MLRLSISAVAGFLQGEVSNLSLDVTRNSFWIWETCWAASSRYRCVLEKCSTLIFADESVLLWSISTLKTLVSKWICPPVHLPLWTPCHCKTGDVVLWPRISITYLWAPQADGTLNTSQNVTCRYFNILNVVKNRIFVNSCLGDRGEQRSLLFVYECTAAAGRSLFTVDKGAEENRGCCLHRGGGLCLHLQGIGNPKIIHRSCRLHHGQLQQKEFPYLPKRSSQSV